MDLATIGLLAYALVAVVVLVDSIVPIVPSEALIVTAAGASASGSLSVVGVVAAAAFGAFAGDVVVHVLGRYAGSRWSRRLERIRGWQKAMGLFNGAGGGVVIVGRYVPLGRTAVAFASGTSAMPWRRYLPAAAFGAALWAAVMTTLGRIASGLTGNPLFTVGIGVVACLVIGTVATVVLRRRSTTRPHQRFMSGSAIAGVAHRVINVIRAEHLTNCCGRFGDRQAPYYCSLSSARVLRVVTAMGGDAVKTLNTQTRAVPRGPPSEHGAAQGRRTRIGENKLGW